METLKILHENAIITGDLDQYCLVCIMPLKDEEEAVNHMMKSEHQKKLLNAPLPRSFPSDRIMKVNPGYYCPYCNVLVPTIAKMNIHIVQSAHLTNKGHYLLFKIGNNIIVFGELVFNKNNWNCQKDGVCTICNVIYDDENAHRNEPNHIVQILQNKCMFGDNFFYRSINEETFFCITCGDIFNLSDKSSHQFQTRHIELYTSAINSKNELLEKTEHYNESEEPINNNEITGNLKSIETKTNVIDSNTDHKIIQIDSASKSFPTCINNSPIDNHDDEMSSDGIKIIKNDNSGGLASLVNKKETSEVMKIIKINPDSRFENDLNTVGDIDSKNDNAHVVSKSKNSESRKEIQNIENNMSNQPESSKHVPFSSFDTNMQEFLMKYFRYQNYMIEYLPDYTYCLVCDLIVKQTTVKMHTKGLNHKFNKQDFKRNKVFTESHIKMIRKIADFIKYGSSEDDKDTDITKDSTENLHQYANTNWIRLTENAAYCVICDIEIPLTEADLTAHTNTPSHKINKVTKESPAGTDQNKIPVKDFVKTITRINYLFNKDVVINNKYVLSSYSFLFIMKKGLDLRCCACDIDLKKNQVYTHLLTDLHKFWLAESLYLRSMDSEFIREVKTEVYHCGFCNEVTNSLKELESHLSSPHHDEAKNVTQWSLERYRPYIKCEQYTEIDTFLTAVNLIGD